MASGFILNYAFSSESVFVTDQQPKVNQGLQKYAPSALGLSSDAD